MLKSPRGGLRIGGIDYPSGSEIPERYRRVLDTSMRPSDPARGMADSPPNMGRLVIPQTVTFSGMSTSLSKAYRYSDEALRHSIQNAHMMLNDPVIAGPLLARQYMVSLLNWSIASEDDKDPKLKEVTSELQAIIKRTPRFTEYRRALLEAVWYGRYACQNAIGFHTDRRGVRRRVIRKWMPLSGDKLMFRYDDGRAVYDPDQVGIRVSAALGGTDMIAGQRQLEPTGEGMAYFLEPWERRQIVIHKHMIRDGEFEDPISGGQVHGVGLRHFLYWIWWQKQEALAQVAEIIDRTGMGFTIYYYPSGNAAARSEMEQISKEQAHTNVILMPSDPNNETRIEQIPPNTTGLQTLHDLVESFFGDMIVRFILGQTLSTKPDATGMNSGVADLQKDTLYNICRYDAVNLEETITNELLLPLRDMNFPKFRNADFYFRISTKVAAPEQELQALQQLWQMGAQIKIADIFDRLDLSMPDADDKTLFNPAIVTQIEQYEQQKLAQASGQMPPGAPPAAPGMPGQPPGQPPLPGQGPPASGPPAQPGPVQPGPEQPGPEQQPVEPAPGPTPQEPIEQDAKEEDPYAEEKKRLFGPILYEKKPTYAERVATAIADTDKSPSAEQRKSGNYRKGRAWLHGLEIVIETPQGLQRKPGWKPLSAHYGYLRRIYDESKQNVVTVGEGNDGDHIDVFVGPNPDSHLVFVIDQVKPDGKFDEWKVILGCNDDQQAKKLYLDSYPAGWKMGDMTPLTIWDLKELLLNGHRGKHAAKHRYSKPHQQRYSETGEWSEHSGPKGGQQHFNVKTGTVKYGPNPATPKMPTPPKPPTTEQSPAAGQVPAQGGMAAKPAMPALPAIAANAPGSKPTTPAQQPSWQTQPMESQAQIKPPVVAKTPPASPPAPPKMSPPQPAATQPPPPPAPAPKPVTPTPVPTQQPPTQAAPSPTTPEAPKPTPPVPPKPPAPEQPKSEQPPAAETPPESPKVPAAPAIPPHAQAKLDEDYKQAEHWGMTDEILRLSAQGGNLNDVVQNVIQSPITRMFRHPKLALDFTRAVRAKHDQMTPADHQELQQWSSKLPAPKAPTPPAPTATPTPPTVTPTATEQKPPVTTPAPTPTKPTVQKPPAPKDPWERVKSGGVPMWRHKVTGMQVGGSQSPHQLALEEAAKNQPEAPVQPTPAPKQPVTPPPAPTAAESQPTPETPPEAAAPTTTLNDPLNPSHILSKLPPLQDNYQRSTHFTNPHAAERLVKNGEDFNYGATLDQTSDPHSTNEQIADTIATGKAGNMHRVSFGDKVIVFDIPVNDYRGHTRNMGNHLAGTLRSPSGVVDNKYIAGYYDKATGSFVQNPNYSAHREPAEQYDPAKAFRGATSAPPTGPTPPTTPPQGSEESELVGDWEDEAYSGNPPTPPPTPPVPPTGPTPPSPLGEDDEIYDAEVVPEPQPHGQPGGTGGPAPKATRKQHIAALDAMPEGSYLFGYTKIYDPTTKLSYWQKGNNLQGSAQIVDAHKQQQHLDELDQLVNDASAATQTTQGPAPTGTGQTPRKSRPFHPSEMPHISTTAAMFGISPGYIQNQKESRNFLIRTAASIGFEPHTVRGDRTDQAVAAAHYLNLHKPVLEATMDMAKKYGWKGGHARELAYSARMAGIHLIKEAVKRGWTHHGQTEQERMAHAMGYLTNYEATQPAANDHIHAITQILGQLFQTPQKWTIGNIALAVAGFYVGYKIMRHITRNDRLRRSRRRYW